MLSLIIPTYNEAGNIVQLLDETCALLRKRGLSFEIIVVDDNSPDETWKVVENYGKKNFSVRAIRRTSERGLSSAVVAGFDAAKGEMLGVMDADRSHDVRILPALAELVMGGSADIAVGSRKVEGGGVGEWPIYRKIFSGFATRLTKMLTRVEVSDPMSGYFCVSRPAYQSCRTFLKPKGYKILLEILAKSQGLRLKEVPYIFSNRTQGQSKLSLRVMVEFVIQLIELLWFRIATCFHLR